MLTAPCGGGQVLKKHADFGVQLQKTADTMAKKLLLGVKATHTLLQKAQKDKQTIQQLKSKVVITVAVTAICYCISALQSCCIHAVLTAFLFAQIAELEAGRNEKEDEHAL